ncbi:MAG TPA: polyprenol monophosphomannose synthase [Iamia sp.]|jgi:dolichol-phosphate mannosyltransferase|nr:polyprenol monophosphomannose synthase [Iamia sp.]
MRAAVLVPTYQERANIEDLLRAIRAKAPEVDVVVIDDASPDGTADAAETVGAELGQVQVLRRAAKDGLGNAYRAGFAHALAQGYDVLVTFDADFSHEPDAIGVLLRKLDDDGCDLVIGSRYIEGGSTPNWPAHRRALSRYGNRYTGWVLRLPVRDITSGFRAYRASTLLAIEYATTRASGYAFMTELAVRIEAKGATIGEVAIEFRDRERGTSKMSGRIIAESMARVTWWGIKGRLRRRPASR